jgi:hypothetical protein
MECSAVTWYTPGEVLRAAAPRCTGCGSIHIAYQKKTCDGGVFKQDGEPVPKPKRGWRRKSKSTWADLTPEQQRAGKLRYIEKAHAEYKLRRKWGIPLHKAPEPRA